MEDYISWVSSRTVIWLPIDTNNDHQTSKSILEYPVTVESQDDYGLPMIPDRTHRRTAHLNSSHTADKIMSK